MTRGITGKKLVRFGSIVLLVVVLAGYGIWRSRDLLFGINFSVSGIQDGMTATSPLLEFSGVSRHATLMTVDGRVVPIAQNGTWSDTIVLLEGNNTVTIAIKDKFGRTITKEYRIYYKQ